MKEPTRKLTYTNMNLLNNRELKNWMKNHFFELVLILALFVSLGIYIVFLKTRSVKSTIYVEASVQSGDPNTNEGVSSLVLDGIKAGDMNDDKTLKITDIVLFQEKKQDWKLSNSMSYIGRIQFLVNGAVSKNSFSYKEQQLEVGNPFLFTIDNRHFQLLITKVQKEPFKTPDYVKKTLLLKIYNKRDEFVQKIIPGLVFKDTNGKEYSKILEVKKVSSPMTSTDQSGNTYLKSDPFNYDLVLKVETLALPTVSGFVGYDERPLRLGERFFFNDPFLMNMDAYIIDVQ